MSQSDQPNGKDHAAKESTPPVEAPIESQAEGNEVDQGLEALITLTIKLPHEPGQMQITVSPQEQVHEVRQSIIDLPVAFQYTCFHLEHHGERINDFLPISEIEGLTEDPEVKLVEDPYTEKEARIHLVRIRELIGAAGDRTDAVQGILPGLSLLDTVVPPLEEQANGEQPQVVKEAKEDYTFDAPVPVSTLLPPVEEEEAPKTIKSISLSAWNPPPVHLKQRGHLLYLVATTNEGEQHQITAHVGGFFVNKSSNAKFDPFPRPAPKGASAHSLLGLLEKVSLSFSASFVKLQDYNNRKDPLATFQITNAIPAAPWIVPSSSSPLCAHSPDSTRSQETYLIAGADNTDTLRDWNEEFQSARELPKDTVQDRVFRERLMSKLFADYNDAATRGAVLVARGEIPPLNPTECKDAQIFVYNNVFFSFGADGVGTFTSEGGDEAARVATGKDVAGVRLVNQLDIDGLFTPATVVVDYLGKRIVGQSIVPGIFKQREPGENQIDYGAVDGKEVVASDERFASVFAKLSQALKVKKHAVWDKDGKRVDLEASVETKGLLGTDARKYVLDLYRVTPLDIDWLEEEGEAEYPHRMAVLRPELIDSYGRKKMKAWVDEELARRGQTAKDAAKDVAKDETLAEPKKPKQVAAKDEESDDSDDSDDSEASESESESESEDGSEPNKKAVKTETSEEPKEVETSKESKDSKDHIDLSKFSFSLNPDVFSGQTPQTDAEKAEMEQDEKDVRLATKYLREQVIPDLIRELTDCDISFPMDGQSLGRLLHKRGINIRYTGKVAALAEDPRLQCLKDICVQDMVARSFKHVAANYLRHLPAPFSSSCISHLLNCLLGYKLNPKPSAEIDLDLKSLYSDADLSFQQVTPESIRANIAEEALKRFRYRLDPEWYTKVKPLQLLREISLKLGYQLQTKEYNFTDKPVAQAAPAAASANNGTPATNGQVNGEGGKKKKNRKVAAKDAIPVSSGPLSPATTFTSDDIVNVVPIVKHSCPRSALAEEALEAGRISIMQNQRKLGQELLLESLSLHEQIYGILHPEVARVYNTLSMLYYQLDEKEAAIELARKAIVVSERTVGVDSAETLLNYLNLSLFLHQAGDSTGALTFAKHALKLWKIIYGADHPDSITTINNGAVMLQHLKAYHESRLWFEESLRICETVFGKNSINAATLLFQLAQALALDQDSKGAVNRMRESYNIFLNDLGPEDKNTKEAESWLEQLTQNAVSIAKHAKDAQARRLRAGIHFTPKGAPYQASSTAPSVSSGPANVGSQLGGSSQMDSRSIDELIKFIEGTDQQTKTPKGRVSRGNPKRRGKSSK
ncbi:Clustered mitochondria protein-like protein [Colletotrichum higginsianum IMI 349063]|uniref:Clustered mitochondria protein homolog n=2 Tax=Colletotrichum higginsianum (strain IMI 349063) TaxID=759273 RepID=A0A1B7YPH7_COLHI|nr:Clustered mitochondria protein-like protein [Colletotrichum higginsianum IMI 349063]OBR13852.1 Clustered mitochondria protein-like protein [Colletotrichum higginsianum IMI 349063]